MLLSVVEGKVLALELTYHPMLIVYRNFRECPEGMLADIAVCKKGEGISIDINDFLPMHIVQILKDYGEILTEEEVQARVASFMGVPVQQDTLATSTTGE